MVSDQEIASCVETLLCGSGGGEASLAAVLQRAQAELGVDLSHKAPYIRDQMDLFFGPRLQAPPPSLQHKTQAPPPPPPPAASAPDMPQVPLQVPLPPLQHKTQAPPPPPPPAASGPDMPQVPLQAPLPPLQHKTQAPPSPPPPPSASAPDRPQVPLQVPPPPVQHKTQAPPPPPPPAASTPDMPQVPLQVPLPPQQMQQQQFAAPLQPQYVFQTVAQLPVVVPGVTAVSAPPAAPAMAFYPPPPLAFHYTNALAGVAAGGTVSFQQPAPVPGDAASPGAVAQVGGENKESVSKRKRGGPGGLNKVCAISPELQTIVGDTVMSRTQIVKQLWAYIRENNLQDPDDKRKIICNDELSVVFGTDNTDMFKMNKLLAKHITPLDENDQMREAKKMKASYAAPQYTPLINQPSVVISDALAKFIGIEGAVPQDGALRYLWDYIKANQLEDTVNESVLCDSKLQELFGCESIPVSAVSDLLAHHFIQRT